MIRSRSFVLSFFVVLLRYNAACTDLEGGAMSHYDIDTSAIQENQVECQSATNVIQKRDKSSVLLDASDVGVQAEELREEEPKPGGHHKGDGQWTGDKSGKRGSACEHLLQEHLKRQTEAMENQESGDVPCGRHPPHVVEYQLVHHRRRHECGHHSWEWGLFPAEEPGRDVDGGFVYWGAGYW
ncbi:hypothetical protein PVL29_012519 [Vitis rotundifolia]|uniref:Secreted protein n=1 Tax=Vitis rotundifolia TaxID=103349 RepID=A0AA39DMD8_VITRO|nr:hypothetical protein PVL29_012519 [Vitis rotundifolia]